MATGRVLEAGGGDPVGGPGWSVIGVGDRLCGGGFEGDFVPEGFKRADESLFAVVGVVSAAGEVVRAEVAVADPGVQNVPDDHNQGVGGGGGRLLPALLAEVRLAPGTGHLV